MPLYICLYIIQYIICVYIIYMYESYISHKQKRLLCWLWGRDSRVRQTGKAVDAVVRK